MKKIMAGTFATLMMGSGMVALGSTAATAGPYTGTVPTSTRVSAPDTVSRGDRATVCVRVTADEGDTRPKGQVTVRIMHNRTNYRWVGTADYSGGKECLTSKRLKRAGKYVVKAKYDRKPNSVWKDSTNTTDLRVTRRG